MIHVDDLTFGRFGRDIPSLRLISRSHPVARKLIFSICGGSVWHSYPRRRN
jgi:hypothetical protein